jgi:hypothetical protein
VSQNIAEPREIEKRCASILRDMKFDTENGLFCFQFKGQLLIGNTERLEHTIDSWTN